MKAHPSRRRIVEGDIQPGDPARAPDGTWPQEILEAISEGVLVLDADLRPVLANSAAMRILGLGRGTLPRRLPSDELLSVARRARDETTAEETLRLWFPTRRTVAVRASALPAGQQILLLLHDATEEMLTQQIRREFVAHASHELKSPVAGIQALAGAIRDATRDDPEAAARFADRLVAEADRLARLINDLLDLSRLEHLALDAGEPIDVSTLAARESEVTEEAVVAKNIAFTARVSPGMWVTGHSDQIAGLIRNLLDNAVRYTSTGGHVTLEVFSDGADVVVRVRDDGIGIPRDAQSRVFERFYRVDRARSRDRGGTGLGLAIVKHVAELHGGTVEVQSELGRGSVFTARLPALRTQP